MWHLIVELPIGWKMQLDVETPGRVRTGTFSSGKRQVGRILMAHFRVLENH
jgi:hypothetical protein